MRTFVLLMLDNRGELDGAGVAAALEAGLDGVLEEVGLELELALDVGALALLASPALEAALELDTPRPMRRLRVWAIPRTGDEVLYLDQYVEPGGGVEYPPPAGSPAWREEWTTGHLVAGAFVADEAAPTHTLTRSAALEGTGPAMRAAEWGTPILDPAGELTAAELAEEGRRWVAGGEDA